MKNFQIVHETDTDYIIMQVFTFYPCLLHINLCTQPNKYELKNIYNIHLCDYSRQLEGTGWLGGDLSVFNRPGVAGAVL